MQTPFRLPLLTALILTTTAAWSADAPVKGGTLIYLEQQAHTNLYPPAGGFYPNGGILNQITDKPDVAKSKDAAGRTVGGRKLDHQRR